MAVHAVEEHYEPTPRPKLTLMPPEGAPEAPPPQPAPKPPKPVRPTVKVEYPTAQLLAVLGTLARLLAARVILILAGMGAFALSLTAVYNGSYPALISSGLYDTLVFLPCIYLALRRE